MNTGSMLTAAITSPTAATMVVFVGIMAPPLSTAIASECWRTCANFRPFAVLLSV